MVIDGPTWAVAVCSAGVALFSPVYQKTVFADVPSTRAVDVSGGDPLTRCGGSSKKSLAAAMAEAAGSAVCAKPPMAVVSAVCRLPAVTDGEVPMVNWLAPGGEFVVACSEIVRVDPSGSVSWNWMVSPLFGLEPRSIPIEGGEPDGPVTVAPVRLESTPVSWKPNGVPSWLNVTVELEVVALRCPNPLVPRSACCRSAITCVNPACAPLPLRMSDALATDGWFEALPEKI